MDRQDADFDIDPIRDEVRAGAEPDLQAIADEINKQEKPEPRTVLYWFATGWFDGRGRVRTVGPFPNEDEYLAKGEARRMREEPNAVRVTVVRQRHEHPAEGGRLIESTIVDDWIA